MKLLDFKPKSTLLEQIAATPRYRLNGLPEDTQHVVVFTVKDKAVEACEAVAKHCPEVKIDGVVANNTEVNTIYAHIHGERMSVPVLKSPCLRNFPQCLAVLYWSGCVAPDLLYHLETAVRQTLNIAIFPRVALHGVGRKLDETLYSRHGQELEEIYAALADDESRLSFASVVKGILLGEIDWLRPPLCPEYLHPATAAQSGDIVLDAGLFDSTILRKFALTVGTTGHVYGFEPEPANMAFVKKSLRIFGDPGNITLIQAGVYSQTGQMYITAQGASGSLREHANMDTSCCAVTTIDDFVEKNCLKRVDLIKMDIEGAEIEALRGAMRTIQQFQPRLAICAYHHIDDLLTIPNLLKKVIPAYNLSFTAHAPYLNEYVYYAVTDRK